MRWLGLLLPLLAACQEPEPAEWTRDYRGYLPGAEDAHVAVFLVRDGRARTPIAGARVRRHDEFRPAGGAWAPLLDETATDEFGLAHFVVEPEARDCHWAVDAEGYAPTEEYGVVPSEIVDLEPGVDRAGRLLDAFGKPAAGVRVQYKVGCAHSPALRATVTDARGEFVLRCIDAEVAGEVVYTGSGVRADYWEGPTLRAPGAPLATEHVLPGTRIRGRLLDATGAPLRDAVVFCATSSRHPLAGVEADGWFTLEGAAPDVPFEVFLADGASVTVSTTFRPGGPFVHRIPEAEEEELEVLVRVPAAPAAWVHLDRVDDGRRFSVEVNDGAAAARVPAGRYEVSAGDAFERFVAPARETEIGPRTPPIVVAVTEQPRLALQSPRLPARARAQLVLPHAATWVDQGKPGAVHLPATVRAVLRVKAEGIVRSFPVAPARDGVRVVRLHWPEPKRIRLVLPTSLRSAELEYGELFEPDEAGRTDSAEPVFLYTHASGRMRLFLECAAGEAVVPVDLPEQEGATVDLGRVAFAPEAEPEPPPAPGACAIRVTVDAEGAVLFVDGQPQEDLEADGLAPGPHVVLVGAPGHVGRAWRVVLKDGETRALRATLAPR